MKILLIVGIIFANVSFSKIHIQQEIKPNDYYVGSEIEYSITLISDNTESQIIFPNKSISTKIFDIKLSHVTNYKAIYNIQCWETGDIWIPEIQVIVEENSIKQNILLDSIKVKVQSILTNNSQELNTIKPNKTIEIDSWKKYFIYFTIIISILTLIYLQIKRKVDNPYLKVVNSNEKNNSIQSLQTKLKELKINHPINNKDAEVYYLSLTVILKSFLRLKYFIKSTEMTSKQIVEFLQHEKSINKDLMLTIIDLIERADTIKFASQLPALDEVETDKLLLYKFIKI